MEIPQIVDHNMIDHAEEEQVHREVERVPLRKSIRERRSTIPDDYEVYLQELDYNIGADNDPTTFSQTTNSKESDLWLRATKYEMKESLYCIYLKVSRSKICFLVLYVDDVLLATNNKGLLHEVKQFLLSNFNIMDIGEASYKAYINKVLERYDMKNCSPNVALIVKDGHFSLDQCPRNDIEREQMKNVPYISTVVEVLRRYQGNPDIDHLKAAKKVLRYLQGTEDYMFVFVSRFDTTSHGVWLKSFTFGFESFDSICRPIRMYCDNSAVVFMAKNNKSGSRSKHIDIKYLAVKERVQEKKVIIEHISIDLMIVDPLTKGMQIKNFKDHVV
ncbi:hypothetical protein RND81_10G042200 [Saponaria officinalis]|uniref:Reverse transcriptase Ty1/copia-type domain-containing protein n=1 Tax=Saponaria officinalis TaxID=3572 RepID=A0AAW1HY88_SAPOF